MTETSSFCRNRRACDWCDGTTPGWPCECACHSPKKAKRRRVTFAVRGAEAHISLSGSAVRDRGREESA